MKYLLKFNYLHLFLWLMMLSSCDDMQDVERPEPNEIIPEPTQLFILSEGLFNLNNSSLALYDLESKQLKDDIFLSVNKRSLGDTANDMALYGSKLYIVVHMSSQIEVVDTQTGKSIAQIDMKNNKGIGRGPRNITFHKDKAYVCSFDSTVVKIDTTSLQIEALVKCGANPDGICVANNKLYVSNSGGLNFPNYENSVSVIDIASFTEIKKIAIGINPSVIHADSEEDVYVISRGNYDGTDYAFHKIDSKTDELVQSFTDIQALNFTIHQDTAYIYNYNFGSQTNWIKVFDCLADTIIRDNFITDNTDITTPYGINVNPYNGDIYIMDAKEDYTVYGDVFCFDSKGKLKFKINEIGLNPNTVVFGRP